MFVRLDIQFFFEGADEDCFFAKNKVTVKNITFPLPGNIPSGLIDHDTMTLKEGVIFKYSGISCWCGCGENYLDTKIVNKGVSKKRAELSFEFVVNEDDESEEEDEEDPLKTQIKEDFPLDEVINTYSHPTYDTHWDCYCKYRKVCGCGCDSDHDGW